MVLLEDTTYTLLEIYLYINLFLKILFPINVSNGSWYLNGKRAADTYGPSNL